MKKNIPILTLIMCAMFLGGNVNFAKAEAQSADALNQTGQVVQPVSGARPAMMQKVNPLMSPEERAKFEKMTPEQKAKFLESKKIPAPGMMVSDKMSARKEMTPELRAEMRTELEQKFADKKKERTEMQGQKRDDKRDARVEKAKDHLITIVERFSSAATRFEDIISRVESRLEKMSADGVNTSSAETFLASAKSDLEKVTVAISNLPSTWEKDSAQIEPTTDFTETSGAMQANKEAFQAVRASIEVVKKDLESARKNIASAISTAKPLQKKADATKVETQASASTESI